MSAAIPCLRGAPLKVTLFHCPAYEARMVVSSCRATKRHAMEIAKKGPGIPTDVRSHEGQNMAVGQRLRLKPCITCKGVRVLARTGQAEPPEIQEIPE